MNKTKKATSLINGSKAVILATDNGVYIKGYKGQVIAGLTELLKTIREDIGDEQMEKIFEASRKTDEETENQEKERIFNMLQRIWKGE